jgi:hypothetical protein
MYVDPPPRIASVTKIRVLDIFPLGRIAGESVVYDGLNLAIYSASGERQSGA